MNEKYKKRIANEGIVSFIRYAPKPPWIVFVGSGLVAGVITTLILLFAVGIEPMFAVIVGIAIFVVVVPLISWRYSTSAEALANLSKCLRNLKEEHEDLDACLQEIEMQILDDAVVIGNDLVIVAKGWVVDVRRGDIKMR